MYSCMHMCTLYIYMYLHVQPRPQARIFQYGGFNVRDESSGLWPSGGKPGAWGPSGFRVCTGFPDQYSLVLATLRAKIFRDGRSEAPEIGVRGFAARTTRGLVMTFDWFSLQQYVHQTLSSTKSHLYQLRRACSDTAGAIMRWLCAVASSAI